MSLPEKKLSASKESSPRAPAELAGPSLSDKIQATLVRQAFIVFLIAGVYFVWQQDSHVLAAASAVYGGAVACTMSLLLAWEVMWLSKNLRHRQHAHKALMFFSFAPRLVIVIAAFWLGVGMLGVLPAPMLVAFSASYIAFLLDFRGRKKPAAGEA